MYLTKYLIALVSKEYKIKRRLKWEFKEHKRICIEESQGQTQRGRRFHFIFIKMYIEFSVASSIT